jgi:5-methyltetrahydropteroyltriglutamate--homocysteine methyltransferase
MTAANRILTSHVGSLARPVRLLDYITAIERGVAVDGGAFEACLKSAVAEVVQQQTRAGVDIVSDGEFGKFRTWSAYVLERLGGIEEREVAAATGAGKDQRTFPEFYAQYFHTQNLPKRGVIVAVAPLTYEGQAAIGRDIDNLKSALAAVKVTAGFLPVVAPASAVPRHQNEFYKSDEEFFSRLPTLCARNTPPSSMPGCICRSTTRSCPICTTSRSRISRSKTSANGRRCASMHSITRYAACRKRRSVITSAGAALTRRTDVPLRDIVDLVLRVKAGAYCLEMANPRHEHEWRVWETAKLPAGRKLIPGVVGHATNIVEHPELVAERIVRLAKLVGRDNVIAGTDCGFAQAPFTTRVHPSIIWAKLSALAEGARLATKELWGK